MEDMKNNSTAIAIEVPEPMTKEQQQRLVQRMKVAMRNEGIEGRILWTETYDDSEGKPVFCIA